LKHGLASRHTLFVLGQVFCTSLLGLGHAVQLSQKIFVVRVRCE